MRFNLQQNVLCLIYQHPLLLDRSRGWAPKNHLLAVENPQHLHPENDAAVTAGGTEAICRFEGEDGSEAPVPVLGLPAIPLEYAMGRRSAAP